VVLACSLIGILVSSARLSFTMFLPTLLDDLGWSRTMLGSGYTFGAWVGACTALTAGIIVDKYGPRLVMVTGGALILLGLTLTSRMTEVWQFYLFFSLLVAMGGSLAHGVPAVSTIRKWFIRKAGLAVALASVGGALGLAVTAFLVPSLIQAFGWRRSWFYIGLSSGVSIMLLAGLVVRKDPESVGLRPDGDIQDRAGRNPIIGEKTMVTMEVEPSWSLKETIRTRSYWCLVAANTFLLLSLDGSLGHLAAFGMDVTRNAGLPDKQGMSLIKPAVFLMAVTAMLGALTGGSLSDRFGRKPVFYVGIGGYGCSLFCSVLIATILPSLWWFLINGAVGGFVFGLTMPLWTPYMGDLFGRASLGALMGVNVFFSGFIGGSGPLLFGWIFDRTGSYAAAYGLGTVLAFTAIILISLVRREEQYSAGRQ